MTDLILVGRVARAHGNKGQVIVNPDTDFPLERFAGGNTLVVDQAGRQAERRIVAVRFQQGRPILALEGIDTIDDAEALAGAELKMPAETLAPLPPRTFYHHDLVGCEVRMTDGRVIGKVIDVQGPLERSLLAVAAKGGEALIPMVEGIVVEVDPSARRIVVDPPAGLIELDARATDGE